MTRGEKISKALRGRKFSPEWRHNLSVARKKQIISQESRSRQGESLRKTYQIPEKREQRSRLMKVVNNREDVLRKNSQGLKRAYAEGRKIPSGGALKGCKHHLSEKGLRVLSLRGQHLRPQFPKPVFVTELGHAVRTTLEKEGYLILKKCGYFYEVEKRFELIRESGKGCAYWADATLIDQRIVVEFKGWCWPEGIEKLRLFKKQHLDYKLVVVTYESMLDKIPKECYHSIVSIGCMEDLMKPKVLEGVLP